MEIKDKKILVVDDEEQILKLIRILLEKEGFENIQEVSSGKDAIVIVENWNPDLILLDINMPFMDGYAVCKKIRESSMVPILFLSAKNEEKDKLKAFSLGGDDFVNKPFSGKELVARIRAKLTRDQYYENKIDEMMEEQKVIKFGNFVFDKNNGTLYKEDNIVELTTLEYRLLECLLLNINCIVSWEQIIDSVWDYNYDGSNNSVMVHLRHLREKIENNPSQPDFIKTVKGRGCIFKLAEKK